jgi:hypothetical protein
MSDRDLDEAFREVSARWDDRGAHASFLEHARREQKLARAAALYREEKTRAPERAEEADRRLGAIVLLATEALQAERVPPPQIRKSVWLTIGAIFMGVAAYVFYRAFGP